MLAEIRDTVSLLPYVRHVAQVNINCRFILLRRLIFRTSNLREFYDARTSTELDLRISRTNFTRWFSLAICRHRFHRQPRCAHLNLTVATESPETFYDSDVTALLTIRLSEEFCNGLKRFLVTRIVLQRIKKHFSLVENYLLPLSLFRSVEICSSLY